MHVPDGFLDIQTSVATGAVSVGVLAVAIGRVRRELEDRTAPLAGLVATFVFAAQMFNFPVGAGTSGHLLGGALAAVLVGPWTAILCMSVVMLVQAMLFADGGITALGTNILLMGIVTVVVGWAVFRVCIRFLPRRTASIAPAAALGAFISVPLAALAFVGLYQVGGTADIPFGQLAAAMLGAHLLIGVGEAFITFAAISGIAAVRPDLIQGARFARPPAQPTVAVTR